MLFSSMTFLWIFLPVVFILYRIAKKDILRNALLLISSFVFYAWGAGPFEILLLLLAIAVNYGFGLMLGARQTRGKVLLAAAVAINAAALCVFKFAFLAGRLPSAASGFAGRIAALVMPVGISFYTFQNIAYLIDIYRGELQAERSFFVYAVNISFFPKLISGPIADNGSMLRQIRAREIGAAKTAYGIKRFIYGLGKKVIIANQLATAADGLFDLEIRYAPTGYLWMAAILYTFQLYYDSSGYADMAIGLGQMFGFDLPENFNYPYIAGSITDFWKRWHMSLTGWFRKYVYFPLGGNRKGAARTLVNIGIIFLLTGIWHGAGFCFIAWGLWHGAFMILERALKPKMGKIRIPGIIRRVYTLLVVIIGWVFFRAGSLTRALSMIRAMLIYQAGDALPLRMFVSTGTLAVLAAAIIFAGPVQTLFPKLKAAVYDKEHTGWLQICGLTAILVLSIVFIVSGTYNAFIYFRF